MNVNRLTIKGKRLELMDKNMSVKKEKLFQNVQQANYVGKLLKDLNNVLSYGNFGFYYGSNEVISVVDHYIQCFLKSSVKKLYVFTDNCRGKNQNITMLRYWQTLVTNKRFEIVHYYFPERGHSFLP